MSTASNDEEVNCNFCSKSLLRQRFIRHENLPVCITCFQEKFCHDCVSCGERIKVDQKDLCHKELHWHDACFTCSHCKRSLVNESFVSHETILNLATGMPTSDRDSLQPSDVFCLQCYDERFAVKCDVCHKSFAPGSKKFEYRGRRLHEECFICCECQRSIGAEKFVPRDETGAIVCCVACFEEKFSKRCTECNKAIKQGGIMYRDKPWHKECFSCQRCQLLLSGQQFVTQNEHPYCLPCYGDLFAKKCTNCTKPIIGLNGYKFISFDEQNFHSECFVCEKCKINLVGKGFLMNGNAIICPECS